MNKPLSKRDAIRELWRLGDLRYFLKGKQIDLYTAFKEDNDTLTVVAASRRWG